MSVLVRRAGDDRATFSSRWERHAVPVARLPGIRGYIQNHVEAQFDVGHESPIQVDGFVELLWDSPEAMAQAFAGPQARPMVEDEPHFLGHGSGYALKAASELRDGGRSKLIVAATLDGDVAARSLEPSLRGLPGIRFFIRDDVASLIPKPHMAPPQRVDVFFHLYFDDVKAADAAAAVLADAVPDGLRIGVYRVRTVRFV